MSQKLRGFVAQGMNGRKSFRDAILYPLGSMDITSGSASITATRPCQALIWAWGPGGSGGANGAASASASGGAAFFKRVRISQGQTISASIGTPGGGVVAGTTNGNNATNTTVTLPNGRVLTAPGGKTNSGTTPGASVNSIDGDINRASGAGATGNNPGSAGERGGAGGASDGSNEAGGGGAGGFSDLAGTDLLGGAGANGNNSSTVKAPSPGGGGGGTGGVDSGAGGDGRVFIVLVRVA